MPSLTATRRTPASLAAEVPRVDWARLGPSFMAAWGVPDGRWEPEHLTVYGRSGSGKTHFVTTVLADRVRLRNAHVVGVITKRSDSTVSALHWPIIDQWPPGYGQKAVFFWPKTKGLSPVHRVPQRAKIRALMDALWRPDSNIIVYWDEVTYIEQVLRLGPELQTFYREGRSHGITNVAAMQRPSNVSRLVHSEAGWTVVFPPKDMDDRKRIAEVLGDRALYMAVLPTLGPHEFVIKHERTGQAYISQLPDPRRLPRSVRAGGHRSA